MMEYASPLAEQPIDRPLESIASAANRVNGAVVRVQSFLDRFNGAKPEPAATAGGLNNGSAIRTPHRESLDRLFAAIDRLEDRLEALDSIG
jgi:hypothetical protein